jgi:uncharacterized protein YjcR
LNIEIPPREELEKLRKYKTRDEIAHHYGVSLSRVKRWIKALSVPPENAVKAKHARARGKAEKRRAIGDDNGLTLLEQARVVLGKRMGEDFRGYLLDGRPVRVDVLMKAAGLKVPEVY